MKRAKKFGIKKGETKTKFKVVKSMLRENINIDIISKVTGLTKEEIENIRKK